MDIKKLRNIRRTNAWKTAEWDYSEIIAAYQFPLLGERPSAETMAMRMDEILDACPQFFPALFFKGQHYIFEGKDELAQKSYDRGIDIMLILLKDEELFDTIDNIIDFMEKELRFDLCCKYLRQLIHVFPEKVLFYDYLTGNIARSRNGDIEEALAIQAKAIELEPANSIFLSNQGWLNLIVGRLDVAETFLQRTLKIKPNSLSSIRDVENFNRVLSFC